MNRTGQYLTGILFIAFVSGLILTGCNDDEATFSDIMGTSPAEAPLSAGIAPPAWSELQKAVPLLTPQLEPMRNLYEVWQSNEDDRHEGTMNFLMQSHNVLEREQFIDLVTYLGARTERERGDSRSDREDAAGRGPMREDRRGNREWAPEGKPGESLRELATVLGLSNEQQEQIQATFQSHREEMKALENQRRAGTLTHEEFCAALDALRAENHEAIVATLTNEQAAAFAESQTTHRVERIQKQLERLDGSDFDNRRIQFLTEVLDLEDEQKAELASIYAEQRAAGRERLEGAISSAGAFSNSGDQGDGGDRRDAMREAHEATGEAIKSLLSGDQREVYDALSKLHGFPGGEGRSHHPKGHGGGLHWHN